MRCATAIVNLGPETMRIVYLAHRIPYPPNKGDKIRSYHHLRYLARRHEVTLCAFVDEREDERWVGPLREYCHDVALVPLDKRAALLRGLGSLARGRSLSEGYFRSGTMMEAVERATARGRFDVGWAFSSVMAQYLAASRSERRIVDLVDVDSAKWRQYADESRAPLRWLYGLEGNRLQGFERELATTATRVLFVSEAEAALFRGFAPAAAAVRVVPNGVDTDYFRPTRRPDAGAAATVLFTGALDYRPNVDAVLWFAREVLPRIRQRHQDACFLAVGHRPERKLLREAAASDGAFRVAGSVPDIRPYFEQAQVYVAPLRLGRGVQNKVLEAMAMRIPVVASPLATTGLAVEPETHLLVATTAAQWGEAVSCLLAAATQRERLAEAAAQLIEQRYTWERNLELLEQCLPGAGRSEATSEGARWTACSA